MVQNLFPKWSNFLPTAFAAMGVGGLFTVVGGVWYYFTPNFWEVGYMPVQPGGGFNHQLHAGQLGMDCRYCHTKVEVAPEANIPNVATCIGCHADNRLNNEVSTRIAEKTQFVRDAYAAGERFDEVAYLREHGEYEEADFLLEDYAAQGLEVVEGGASIQWRRVHKLPDYVRNFPHNAHVNAGVSCFSCHGQVTAMPIVYQDQSLSMAWCLDCHRDIKGAGTHPETRLVPKDRVFDPKWVEDVWMGNLAENRKEGVQIASELQFAPPENCGACHY